MNPCHECKLPKTLIVDPLEPDRMILCEDHKPGCSWSPMIAPFSHRWHMRSVPRTDTPDRGKAR